MDLFLWTNYEENEITEKTKYWVDLWEELIEDFTKDADDTELVNPHVLLMILLDEIKYNRLKNKNNNIYFLDKLNFFCKNDDIIKKLFNTDFKLIITELSQKSRRFEYFILLCEQTIESFQKGIYFEECCDLLKKIILSSQWVNGEEQKIKLLSKSLIIELILAGYSITKIQTIPRSLFDKYDIWENDKEEVVSTRYPTSLEPRNYYVSGKFNSKFYYEALKKEIDSLSISDRVNRLKYYFYKEPIEGYGIFHIEGVKGNIDKNIGEVNFYSPKIEEYMKSVNDPERKVDNFNEKKLEFYDNDGPSLNAAVKIRYRDFESAKKQALNIIEKSLDLLRLHIHSEVPFRVKQHRFYLVDCENLGVSGSFSSKDDKTNKTYKELSSFDLTCLHLFSEEDKVALDNFNKLLSQENVEKSPLSAKLIFSLHWYRKAFETNVVEDKLLNYWIVIENLITFESKNENLVLRDQEERDKFILVEELVPFVELSHSIRNIAIDTYRYFDCLAFISKHSHLNALSGCPFKIPKNYLDAYQLGSQTEKKINLEEFVKSLHLLSPHITRKISSDKIEFTEKFYCDAKFACFELERKLEQTKQDLLLIYRYRNLIVHNARFDNNILPYYVMKAEKHATNILREVLYQYIEDSTRSHQEILIREKVKMERLIEKLNNNISVDLWQL